MSNETTIQTCSLLRAELKYFYKNNYVISFTGCEDPKLFMAQSAMFLSFLWFSREKPTWRNAIFVVLVT